jgi:uncharacterized protein (TIGR02246 family)
MKLATLSRRGALLLLGLCAVTFAIGQEAEESTPEVTKETAVRAVLDEYVAAFNRRDPAAMGTKWVEQGVFVNETNGTRTIGRAAIERNLTTLLGEESELTLGGRIDSVRFIRPDVAEVSGQAVTVGPDDEPNNSTFVAILVREEGAWLFDSIHETQVLPPTSTPDQLESLDFLVGRWVDDTDDARVESSVFWSANQAFLVRTYEVQRDDDIQRGTQVIGWDPRQERIRSWTFDSEGSFGEGLWSSDDDAWRVKLTQTLADGRISAATQVITSIDENTLSVQMVGREVEGELLPSTEPVRMVRVSEDSNE